MFSEGRQEDGARFRTVSVVITNYNYGRYLRQAIGSVLAQSHPAELVVVDDGSVDDSREVMRSFGGRIKTVQQENGGQGSAFNAGFAAATGAIVCFLDADDYLAPNAVERIVAHWTDETDMLHHRLQIVNDAGQALGLSPPAGMALQNGDVVPIIARHGGYNCPPTSGLAYSRRLLEKILPMPVAPWRICADAYLTLAGAFHGRVSTMEEGVAFYRLHGANQFGVGPGRRQRLTRAGLKRDAWNARVRDHLIRRLLREAGFAPPTFRVNYIYLWELLIYRSSARRYRLRRGLVLFRRLWLRPSSEGTPGENAKKLLAGAIITFAPRAVLRRLYPGVFA